MSRVALVTGGATRLGRAITLGLAEAGYDVVIHFNRSEAEAHHVASRVEELGRRAVTVGGDLADAESARRLKRAVDEEFGRLDLVVNNASLFRLVPFSETDQDEWDRVMAVNLRAPFLVVREVADLLRTNEGSVVNLVDLSAIRPFPGYPHHSVSKAGLLHLTRVMALALAPAVRVNAVAPGMVLPPTHMDQEAIERERRKIPLRSVGDPQDVVRTVLFLADSLFVTGEVIVVDGGRHLSG